MLGADGEREPALVDSANADRDRLAIAGDGSGVMFAEAPRWAGLS
jgi:hypothetical protein